MSNDNLNKMAWLGAKGHIVIEIDGVTHTLTPGEGKTLREEIDSALADAIEELQL